MDDSLRFQPENSYPPYNILRTAENSFRISLAVAGFKPDQQISKPDQLIVGSHTGSTVATPGRACA
jgi:HSP20 family molecular chaperone IbpA